MSNLPNPCAAAIARLDQDAADNGLPPYSLLLDAARRYLPLLEQAISRELSDGAVDMDVEMAERDLLRAALEGARVDGLYSDLVEALHTCLPFLEDMKADPAYKPGRVDTVLRGVRKLLERVPK